METERPLFIEQTDFLTTSEKTTNQSVKTITPKNVLASKNC